MHVLHLLGVSCAAKSLLTWLDPRTFAYLNNGQQLNVHQPAAVADANLEPIFG